MKLSFGAGLVAAACLGPSMADAQVEPPGSDAQAEPACLALAALALPELIAIEVSWHPAGSVADDLAALRAATGAGAPAHCRVRGQVDPAIGIEVWLPAGSAWNGRFLGVGSPDHSGSLDYAAMLGYLSQGYATAATDTGHRGASLDWLADRLRLRDYGYRAVYEMTAKAGAMLTAFYGRPADYRYFNGCSTGGRQGLMEAARFPEDYDGIVAGAPLNPLVAVASTRLWLSQTLADAGGRSLLTPSTLALVRDSAVEQCDVVDGVLDGVLEDPRRCNFVPERLQCAAGPSASCLAPAEVAALRQVYRGPMTDDRSIALPGFAFGTEDNWTFAAGSEPDPLALQLYRRAVLADPFWDWRRFDLAADHALALERVGWMLDVTDLDLSSYRDSLGKLLIYQGWNDTTVSPEAAIASYETIESRLAGQPNPRSIAVDDFVRLFMVPGMRHCGGGIGTDQFDAQRAIEDWVERGIPPSRLEASRVENDAVVRTRPLCPYPQVARYRGSGNSDRSGSFVCDF